MKLQNYKLIRNYKDGRILLGQKTKTGITGYDSDSPDYNRILLLPGGTDNYDGRYVQHCYCEKINLGDIEFDGKIYEFRGEY